MNPTQAVVEDRVAALEGGVAALLVASGQAAETLAMLNIAEAGDHIVSSPSLYGGTYNLFHYTFPKLGIEVSFVDDPDDLEQWRAAVRPNTKAFFGETISNPKNDILDIEGVAEVAHEVGVPLIVDNTVATPYLIRPFEWGADIVVHSATKYLGGHGTAIAGVIVDSGNFDYAQTPSASRTTTSPTRATTASSTRVTSASARRSARTSPFILKARVQLLRDLGSAISPFNAFLIAQGIETLSLRIERHVANAQEVAEWLEARDEVESVNYAGLPSSPWYERGKKYAPRGTGAVLAFEIEGGVEAGKQFVEALELHSHVANIGDVRSLVIHPASTTHSQLTAEEQAERRRHAGPRAPRRRPRGHRGHPRRPRRRLPRRQGRLSTVPTSLGLPPASGAWREGDPVGHRRFADVGPLALELGGRLDAVTRRVRDLGDPRPHGAPTRSSSCTR